MEKRSSIPDQRIKLGSPALQADYLPIELSGKPRLNDPFWENEAVDSIIDCQQLSVTPQPSLLFPTNLSVYESLHLLLHFSKVLL